MTAGQFLAMLKQLPPDELRLPIVFQCSENNIEGHRNVGTMKIASADFGKLVLILPEQKRPYCTSFRMAVVKTIRGVFSRATSMVNTTNSKLANSRFESLSYHQTWQDGEIKKKQPLLFDSHGLQKQLKPCDAKGRLRGTWGCG